VFPWHQLRSSLPRHVPTGNCSNFCLIFFLLLFSLLDLLKSVPIALIYLFIRENDDCMAQLIKFGIIRNSGSTTKEFSTHFALIRFHYAICQKLGLRDAAFGFHYWAYVPFAIRMPKVCPFCHSYITPFAIRMPKVFKIYHLKAYPFPNLIGSFNCTILKKLSECFFLTTVRNKLLSFSTKIEPDTLRISS
jgi:hypothetical protein